MLSSAMSRCVALVRNDFPLKHQFLQELLGVISQKTAFFMVIAMKTSNLTPFCNDYTYQRQLFCAFNNMQYYTSGSVLIESVG
jgi:hypothetical protein